MRRTSFLNIVVQILIAIPLAVLLFNIGVMLVVDMNMYPPVAALPLYPLFALFLAIGLQLTYSRFGIGLYLNQQRFALYFKNHLIAFACANSCYWMLLQLLPAYDFRILAVPCMFATLVISGALNKRNLRTEDCRT